MHFKIESHINLQNEIQNITKKKLQTTLLEIQNQEYTLAKKVHQIRKMCKSHRGLLQIIKPILKEPTLYQTQNTFYREMAKLLAGSRETKVMLDMFELLIKNHTLPKDKFLDIEKSLKKQSHDENFSQQQINTKLEICKKNIQQEIQDLKHLKLNSDDLNSLKIGFQTTYKKAYKSIKKALEKSDIEEFHTFRKFAKYHMYHVNLLSKKSLFPKSREKELKKLTDILGIEHDLSLFETYLIENKKLFSNTKLLIPYLHKEQKRLRKTAHSLEKKLFKLGAKKITHYAII